MSVDALLALLVVLVIGNYWLNRSVLYPSFLFCSMWLAEVAMYRMDLLETDPVHSDTLAIIGGGAFLFTCGGLLAMIVPKVLIETKFVLTRLPPRNNLIKPLMIVFLACGLPLMVRSLLQLASTVSGTGSILQRARIAAVQGNAPPATVFSSIASYFILWAIYAAVLFLIERNDKYFWMMTFVALAGGVLSTGRTPVMMLIVALTCVQLMISDRHRFWHALQFARVPIFIFLCLYFGLVFLDKDTSSYEGGIAGIILFFLVAYIVGPMAAFDYVLRHPQDYAGTSNHTFKFFLSVASTLHLVQWVPPPLYDVFVYVPYPTNVYTIYKFFYLDFGFYGMLAAITLIGFLQTLLYRKARTGSVLGLYFFSLTLYALIVSVFDDSYSAFGSYIDAFLLAAIYITLRSIPVRILPRLASGYGSQLATPPV
jgi:oligosaccharide repeat unit polymerase